MTDDKNIQTATTGKKHPKGNWLGKAIVIGLLAIALIVYFAVPPVHDFINEVVNMFKTGNFEAMRNFISQYGGWAVLVSSLLMIFQSIAAPLPAFFITLANANLFGWWQGCIISFVSSMIGAAMCFYIARILGRDIVEKICTKGALLQIEEFFDKYGSKCILIARLLPFISFDVVSYAAGLTGMTFWSFFIATGIGQLPACIVYSYVGGMLTGGAKLMFTGLLCLFALAILVILIKQVYTANEKKKKAAAEAAGVEYVKIKRDKKVIFSKFYNAAFIAMSVAMLLDLSSWLDDKINIGWIFFGMWLVLFIIALLVKKFKSGMWFTICNVVINLIFQGWILGRGQLFVAPATIVKKGIMMPALPIEPVNGVLVVLTLLGLALICLLFIKKGAAKDGQN